MSVRRSMSVCCAPIEGGLHLAYRIVALLGCLSALGLGGCGSPRATPVTVHLEPAQSPSAHRGRRVYRQMCAACHGAAGNGLGPAADGLDPAPRDFARGVYQYRSTQTGMLPLDNDLARTVLDGIPGTSMAGWRDQLTTQEVTDVVAYIKTFSPEFALMESEPPEDHPTAVAIPAAVPVSATSVARGKEVWVKLQCGKCHGERGDGDGWAKNDEMKDDRGNVVHAADLTRGVYRSGNTPEALYRTIVTGMDGTPMPAYEGASSADDTYHMINYMLAQEREGLWWWLTTAPIWYEPSTRRATR